MLSTSLSGTVALVSGASSGIGEATARTLAQHGAAVALVARRTERLDKLAATIPEAEVFTADLTVEGEAEATVGRVVDRFGRLDTLVNAAGIMLVGPAVDAPLREWQHSVDLNVTALLRLTHAALPFLRLAAGTAPREVSDIVNISSVAGRQAIGGAAVYSATKFAVTAFGEALRQELTREHVRVSSVEPGAVTTELTQHIRDGVREHNERWYASMETLVPEDVADAVAYIVTRPRHVAVSELLVRPTEQS
jgi:NADP-dependent 3-hydroxy acid dehydrogenase YdfG